MFVKGFDKYACEGDLITCHVDGFDVTARIVRDNDHDIDDDDSHNPDQKVTGCDREQQRKLLEARKAWKRNEWFYCGVVLSVSRQGVKLGDGASLWGIECNYPGSDNAYLLEIANELLPEALTQARETLNRLVASV